MTKTVQPKVSVVIPCRNGAVTLTRQLDALAAQEPGVEFEVVIADNGSDDDSADRVRARQSADPRFRLVDASGRTGVNAARNAGVRAASADWIVLCDVDDRVSSNWLRAYVRGFDSGHSCLGGGYDETLPSGTVVNRVRQLPLNPFTRRAFPIGANCGFTKEVFEAVGGFDESLAAGGDEVDFFWRADDLGHAVAYTEGAEISYSLRTGARNVLRQHAGYGSGMSKLLRRHASLRQRTTAYARIPFGLVKSFGRILFTPRNTIARRRALESLAFWWGMARGILRRDVS